MMWIHGAVLEGASEDVPCKVVSVELDDTTGDESEAMPYEDALELMREKTDANWGSEYPGKGFAVAPA